MKRPANARATVAKSRATRLRDIERRRGAHLRFLRRKDPDGHAALVGMLQRVVAQQVERTVDAGETGQQLPTRGRSARHRAEALRRM